MKILTIEHKNIPYKFRYLNQSGIIEITKGDQFIPAYTMKWNGRLFVCDCPGNQYHGKCWHKEVILSLMVQEDENDLWASLSEEIGVIKYKPYKTIIRSIASGPTNSSWT